MNKAIIILSAIFVAGQTVASEPIKPKTPKVDSDNCFPVAVQFTPVPSGRGWNDSRTELTESVMKETIENIVLHGCTHLAAGEFSQGGANSAVFEYAQSVGMKIDYTTNGVQLFKRNLPPEWSVYSPEYLKAVKERIEPVLGKVKELKSPHTIFPFMDEPFHADTTSFDYREDVAQHFFDQYGYTMPASYAQACQDAAKHLDFINFQSSLFTEAWRKIYRLVKEYDPRPNIVMTHDSHNTMGGGVESDSKYAVDDIYHWGGDFADMFIYDIYPYTMFDYRYGEYGKLPKPRISQMHYTMAQMRNLTTQYGKKLGFWLGTYNEGWFRRYLTGEMRSQYWMERELAYTAIAGGSDFIITGINIPQEAMHWDDFGRAMSTVQKVGGEIVNAKRPKANAAFLFPRSQYIQTNEEYFNVGLTFELCMRAFGELDIIHEEQITDADMNGYKILILADIKMLPDEVADNIAEFVKRGGVVIADCLPQTDICGKPSDKMKKLFGVSAGSTDRVVQKGQWNPFSMLPATWAHGLATPPPTPKKLLDKSAGTAFGKTYDFDIVTPRNLKVSKGKVIASMQSGQPLAVVNKTGKGETYMLGFCLQDTYFQTYLTDNNRSRNQLCSFMNELFAQTNIESHTYSSNPDMEVGVRTTEQAAYVFVINHEADNAVTSVELRDLGFEVGRIEDVEWGRTVDFVNDNGTTRFKILAVEGTPTGVTRLLKVTPKAER